MLLTDLMFLCLADKQDFFPQNRAKLIVICGVVYLLHQADFLNGDIDREWKR